MVTRCGPCRSAVTTNRSCPTAKLTRARSLGAASRPACVARTDHLARYHSRPDAADPGGGRAQGWLRLLFDLLAAARWIPATRNFDPKLVIDTRNVCARARGRRPTRRQGPGPLSSVDLEPRGRT